MKTKTHIFIFKFWPIWTVIVLLYFFITIVSNIFIYTDAFYYDSLSDKLNLERITEIISFQHKFQIIGYLFIPVVLLLKLWIIAGIIFTSLILLYQKVSYRNCLKITLIAELASVIAALVRTSWLMIDMPSNTDDFQKFSPLSIAQFSNLDRVPNYFFYPLHIVNIFEVAYWILLTYGVMVFSKQTWGKSLKTVASSYGVALFIWVVFIVFIQVQFT